MARDLQERLQDAPDPRRGTGAASAGWRVVSAAYADRRPVTQPARHSGAASRLAAGLAALAPGARC